MRVAVAYAIAAWLLLEVSSVLAPALRLPEWADTLVVFLLILGFPIALILAWAFELTPEGVKADSDVDRSDATSQVSGRKLDFFIIAALSAALIYVVFLQDDSIEAPVSETIAESSQSASPDATEEQNERLRNSIAVLPFDNLSPNPDDAFFAAGLHDEILRQLAKLGDLSVISRTSVLRYDDSAMSIPEIAGELNVETVMEGSVRYADGRVRITVQLIDATSDEHMWAETYDREFADIFAIETDIATKIANSLQAELTPAERAHISSIPTTSPEAFGFYLRASNIVGTSSMGMFAPAVELDSAMAYADRAIEIDPQFADAYALRGLTYFAQISRIRGDATEWESQRVELEEKAFNEFQKAISLNANLAVAYRGIGAIHQSNWRGEEARAAFEKALALAPNDATIISASANFFTYAGYSDISTRLTERAVEIAPNLGIAHHIRGMDLAFSGQDDEAYKSFQRALETYEYRNSTTHLEMAWIAIRQQDRRRAVEHAQIADNWESDKSYPDAMVTALLAYTYGLLGIEDGANRLFDLLRQRSAEEYIQDRAWFWAYLAIRDGDRALDFLKRAAGRWVRIARGEYSIKTNHYHDPILDQPEFVAIRPTLGYTDL